MFLIICHHLLGHGWRIAVFLVISPVGLCPYRGIIKPPMSVRASVRPSVRASVRSRFSVTAGPIFEMLTSTGVFLPWVGACLFGFLKFSFLAKLWPKNFEFWHILGKRPCNFVIMPPRGLVYRNSIMEIHPKESVEKVRFDLWPFVQGQT